MSNVMKELKAEISRLARKEIKKELAPARKATATQRGLIADLRRQVNAIQKELGALKKAVPSQGSAVLSKEEPQGQYSIMGRQIKASRKRLGMTQKEFGKLVGVSSQSVFNWERKRGKVVIRKATADRLLKIQGVKKQEVAENIGKGKKSPKKS
ncbi:XRE family transcriptional regulator [Candidatus Saccharibacteria bacterium]|nr:XRE family transcriptional regulator [Candidatus Saccharibacteria bacterium]